MANPIYPFLFKIGKTLSNLGTQPAPGSTQPTPGSTTTLRSHLGGYGMTPEWSSANPNYVTIGSQSYRVGSIPGTTYDPASYTHYVTDPAALMGSVKGTATSAPGGGVPYTTLPPAPSLDYSTPYVPEFSWEEALARASAMYDPQYQLSRQRTEKMYSEQRERLPQVLAARGYLKGGKREAGEQGITQDQAMALSELQNQFETQKQQAAHDIYTGETARAYRTMQQLVELQNAKNLAEMQKWQTQYSAALQKDLQDRINSNSLLKYFVELFLNE